MELNNSTELRLSCLPSILDFSSFYSLFPHRNFHKFQSNQNQRFPSLHSTSKPLILPPPFQASCARFCHQLHHSPPIVRLHRFSSLLLCLFSIQLTFVDDRITRQIELKFFAPKVISHSSSSLEREIELFRAIYLCRRHPVATLSWA